MLREEEDGEQLSEMERVTMLCERGMSTEVECSLQTRDSAEVSMSREERQETSTFTLNL